MKASCLSSPPPLYVLISQCDRVNAQQGVKDASHLILFGFPSVASHLIAYLPERSG
jgi:hypothetical protein